MTIMSEPIDLVNGLHCTRVNLQAERIGPAPAVPLGQRPELHDMAAREVALFGLVQIVANRYGCEFHLLPGAKREAAWALARSIRIKYAGDLG